MKDLDLEMFNVTWCQDDSDYGATRAPSDYDYEVTSASDRGEPEGGLLVRGDGQRGDLVDCENGQDRSTLEGKG